MKLKLNSTCHRLEAGGGGGGGFRVFLTARAVLFLGASRRGNGSFSFEVQS